MNFIDRIVPSSLLVLGKRENDKKSTTHVGIKVVSVSDMVINFRQSIA